MADQKVPTMDKLAYYIYQANLGLAPALAVVGLHNIIL